MYDMINNNNNIHGNVIKVSQKMILYTHEIHDYIYVATVCVATYINYRESE